jgi:hypothetical protein
MDVQSTAAAINATACRARIDDTWVFVRLFMARRLFPKRTQNDMGLWT